MAAIMNFRKFVLGFVTLLLSTHFEAYACQFSNPNTEHINYQPLYVKGFVQRDINDRFDGRLELIYPWSKQACTSGTGLFAGVLAFDVKHFSLIDSYAASSFNWGKLYYLHKDYVSRYEILSSLYIYRTLDFELEEGGDKQHAHTLREEESYLVPEIEFAYALDKKWVLHINTELVNYDHNDNYIARLGISNRMGEHRHLALVWERRSWHLHHLEGFQRLKGFDRSAYLKVLWNINRNNMDKHTNYFNVGLSLGQRQVFQQLDDGAVDTARMDEEGPFVLIEVGLGNMYW